MMPAPALTPVWSTLVDILRWRAEHQAGREAYTFLLDGEQDERRITYSELDRRARAIAAQLQSQVPAGSRAVLLYPPGLDYVASFYGCLYAGVVAVPLYPPRPNQRETRRTRLNAILGSAQPAAILTTFALVHMVEDIKTEQALHNVQIISTDRLDSSGADSWKSPDLRCRNVVLLQYTSGSTAIPKGVILSHNNLLQNCKLIEGCFEQNNQSRSVIWLPPYHDMGLIGGIIQPLFTGFPAILMSPVHFLQRPIRWLQAISRHHATTSGGPNFAYDLCLRKISPQLRSELDLSSWRVAFNGAEPVRPGTLEDFSRFFGPCGFRPESFVPCYGLAEATLLVSGAAPGREPLIRRFQESSETCQGSILQRFIPAEDGRPLVSCGKTLPEQETIVVDPATSKRCPAGQVGEFWVGGPSVAQGYWNLPEETAAVFHVSPAGREEREFLRTGDLGFLHDDEIFITGRLKDLIIIRGQNHYPQDIELTVERSSPVFRPGCGAAFAVNVHDEEQLVVVQELERQYRNIDTQMLCERVRQAVGQHHEIQPWAVMLLPPGGIPKTSSGKIQRHACREAFLNDALPVIGSRRFHAAIARENIDPATRAELRARPEEERFPLLQRYVHAEIAAALRIAPSELKADEPLLSTGIDSLTAIELQHRLELGLQVYRLNPGLLCDLSPDQITAEFLRAVLEAPASPFQIPSGAGATHLSHGQRALWYLHQIAPNSTAYNIVCALRARTRLNVNILESALRKLVERHASLQTAFVSENGEPFACLMQPAGPLLKVEDPGDDGGALKERMQAVADQPFDLQKAPLFRVHVFGEKEGQQVLLLVIHHVVTDFWSLAVLARDLGELYRSEMEACPAELPTLGLQYADYVAWQNQMLGGIEGSRLWSFWQQELHGELPILSLPADKPRPSVQTWNGAVERLRLNQAETDALGQFCRTHGVTFHIFLLSLFQVLLCRHSGGTDLLVGSPASGRSRPEFSQITGYFISPIVVRSNLEGNPSFNSFLRQVRQTQNEALKHADMPFALLAERLQPVRDASRSPVFQAMFMWQQAPPMDQASLTLLGLGESGAQMMLGEVLLESLQWDQHSAQFDVTLVAAKARQNLHLLLQYNTDIFVKETIERMLGRLKTLAFSVLSNPHERIQNLGMLDEEEIRQILRAGQGPASPQDADHSGGVCIHTQFARQAVRTPTATALVFNEQEISYDELDRSANRLAHHLQKLGVRPEIPVAIAVKRSPAMVTALLAVMKAGGAYVPLDPDYPRERLLNMLEDSGAPVLITDQRTPGLVDPTVTSIRLVYLHSGPQFAEEPASAPVNRATGQNAAYIIYTSGSTGKPKGVVIQHGSVLNFFAAMDKNIGCSAEDTLLAVTSISFDISVLELFWVLTRGGRVVLMPEQTVSRSMPGPQRIAKKMQFSLFYFASDSQETQAAKYRLVTEGAKFADRHGFTAVWTPERHFHAFGGLYPNPSVMSAMLAGITERIQIRAGSVVLPLHDPIRVAEEWALVDNLSNGRIGVAFASGWHANDFVFFPERFADRKEVMYRQIEIVQNFWKGEPANRVSGAGNEIAVRIFPRPVQPKLPVWITAAGSSETFIKAGQLGMGVLTHLLGQTVDEVVAKVKLYQDALENNGHAPGSGHVTLMLHTFVGKSISEVCETVRQPFTAYLRSSISLIEGLIKTLGLPFDLRRMSNDDMEQLLKFAFDRYFETSALFGTVESCSAFVEGLRDSGIDEIACLIDFGVETELVLQQLERLAAVQERVNRVAHVRNQEDRSLTFQAQQYRATMLQCTPSLMGMLAQDQNLMQELQSLRVLMLGGEALPPALVQQLKKQLPARIVNMYGPTETTIWSMTHAVEEAESSIPIGRPILNTQTYILDGELQPVAMGHIGELYIGGAGVARGYLNQPVITAERFAPDPFGEAGGRLYRTGDLVCLRRNGTIEFTGRADQQVKLRGFRIELGEIESVLGQHSCVRQAVVVVREEQPGDKRLAAYVVPRDSAAFDARSLQDYLKAKLPAHMVPSIVTLSSLPHTPNGKIDRKALLALREFRQAHGAEYVAPQSKLEQTIASIWRQVLQVDQVGAHDNFFDRGGHSLLMAQVQSQLQSQLQREIPLIKLLEHPTIASLAAYLRQEEHTAPRLNQSIERAQRQLESRRQRRAFSDSKQQ